MEMIRVENLCKTYGEGENEVKAVNNVSFSVDKGEFVAIVGSSGSGKSTLLHLLGGLDKVTSGKVFIGGKDISAYHEETLAIMRRRKIGFIFQSFNLIPILTVRENIKMPILLDNAKPDQEYLDELIEMLGLTDRQEHLPNQLSGGQQQRVAIARAMANNPAIILADEPTGNLDKQNTKEVIQLLKSSVKKYEQTLILITHEMSIAGMADRVITLSDGQIVSDTKDDTRADVEEEKTEQE
ncbi:MAG: ABC transporter ATP-binding protein [Lachnospiraceae bacterium]|nr:ABC transporter ATP-binding protein [Lachnospiraceae bacterium]